MTTGPAGDPQEPSVITLKQAAELFGVSYSYMQVLPSRHGDHRARPFPEAVGMGPGRQKLYPRDAVTHWMLARDTGGRPKSRPPEYMSDGQWLALVKIASGVIKQLPYGERYWGTHPIGDGVHAVLDQRVVGSLMAEGYVRAVGRRGKSLRFELTTDGRAVIDGNPEWVARAQRQIAAEPVVEQTAAE